MANNIDPEQVIKDIVAILDVLSSDPSLKVNKKTQAEIKTSADRLKKVVEELLPKAESAVTKLINERNDLAKALNADRTAGLSAVRGSFGPDSDEYEQAGGTRASERAKPTRKKTPPKP